jgi:hypothetical protein
MCNWYLIGRIGRHSLKGPSECERLGQVVIFSVTNNGHS